MRRRSRVGTLLLSLLVLTALAAQEGGYKPYREKLPDGEVDWYEGWIRATATVPLDAKAPRAKAQMDARRVAVVKAQAAALRIAMKVPVDSERRLEGFEALKVRVRGIVSGSQVVEEHAGAKEVTVTLEVPVAGVHGLLAEVATVVLPPPEPAPAPKPKPAPKPAPEAGAGAGEATEEPASFAQVTLDATEAGARPALFPRIVDPEGKEVYTAKTIGRLGDSGKVVARYVTPPAGDRSFRGPAGLLPGDLPLAALTLGGPLWLLQGTGQGRKRGGGEPLLVKASGTKGTLKSDIVVTAETAKKLREAEAASGVLSEGKVVVVVRSDVGGVEGRRRAVADALEFARK